MKTYSRLRAVIDLDAIKHNMEAMHAHTNADTQMIAVIKTDAYGHGAVPIAEELEELDYVWGFAVAIAEEAHIIRRAGIKKPVLCLGCAFEEQLELMIREEIRMTISAYESAKKASEIAGKLGKKALLHIKVDTGMSRIGFPAKDESVNEIVRISELPNIELEGMFTHFSKSDETDKETTKRQQKEYLWMREKLEEKGIVFSYYHSANSAAIIDMPETNMDIVRAGIAIYGLYPSEEVDKTTIELKPAMELKAHITHVKWIERGTEVSYGGTFVARDKMKIATIPVGYGDGYPRSLSNKGHVLIHGQKARILGRVCMDQFMVDVTGIENVAAGTEVTLVGKDGDSYLAVEELAELSGRFNYEFICDINKRVPREYISEGKIVAQVDYF